jgi:hypothetical protein
MLVMMVDGVSPSAEILNLGAGSLVTLRHWSKQKGLNAFLNVWFLLVIRVDPLQLFGP